MPSCGKYENLMQNKRVKKLQILGSLIRPFIEENMSIGESRRMTRALHSRSALSQFPVAFSIKDSQVPTASSVRGRQY